MMADAADARSTADRVGLDVALGPAAATVLERVLGILAARADLSVDSVSDVLLASDTLATAARHIDGDRLELELVVAPGRLDIVAGPFANGGAEALLDERRVGDVPIMSRLADELVVQDDRLRISFRG
jgi:serine/threonine-protein kinase RsbW